MLKTHNRPRRMGELIQRELARLLLKKANDPRFRQLALTAVDVAPDLANAKVFVSILNVAEVSETIAALNKAAGFLRFQLSRNLHLRVIPRLHFVYDESV